MRVACVRRPQGTGAPAGRRKVCPQAHCVTDRAEDVREEKGYKRRQGKRVGTHDVQYVCCEVFVLKDGMTPDSAASLAQRKDMCRVLPGGGVRDEE